MTLPCQKRKKKTTHEKKKTSDAAASAVKKTLPNHNILARKKRKEGRSRGGRERPAKMSREPKKGNRLVQKKREPSLRKRIAQGGKKGLGRRRRKKRDSLTSQKEKRRLARAEGGKTTPCFRGEIRPPILGPLPFTRKGGHPPITRRLQKKKRNAQRELGEKRGVPVCHVGARGPNWT